ncbi:hypothetical protein ACN28S_62000 [Cystobacter fuscus]
MLGEIAITRGVDARLSMPARAFRGLSRRADLYWLTHLFLLDTRYLRAPLLSPDASAWTEELLAATPELIEGLDLDRRLKWSSAFSVRESPVEARMSPCWPCSPRVSGPMAPWVMSIPPRRPCLRSLARLNAPSPRAETPCMAFGFVRHAAVPVC